MSIHKLHNEPLPAFDAFKEYCAMETGVRSYAKVALIVGRKKHTIIRWGGKYQWVARCLENDEEKEERFQVIEDHIALASAERHVKNAKRLQEIALDEIERLAEISSESPIPLIRPQDAIKMIDLGFKMERLVSGETTERDEHILTTTPLSRQEISRYNSLIDQRIMEGDDTDVDV